MTRAFAMIAGGGTAGHVVPALAIGEALVDRGHARDSIRFVGSRRGIDRRLVPAAGFPLTLLPGRGLARKLTLSNVGALAGFAAGLARATVLVGRSRPRVVVSMGGYAAAPCALAAALWRIPLVLSEQNAVPTATHRLVGRFAAASAVPFEGTPMPRPVVTGTPVAPAVLAADFGPAGRLRAREALGLPGEGVVVAALGGSLGARTVNAAVAELVARWDGPPLAVRHALGARDWAARTDAPDTAPAVSCYQALEYEERMPELLAAADLVVCRSGGATVAELAVAGRAAILVPLPVAPYDHQAANARRLVEAGGAVMVRDHELTGDRLMAEVAALVAGGGPGRLRDMGRAAAQLGRPEAAAAVADVVEEAAGARGAGRT